MYIYRISPRFRKGQDATNDKRTLFFVLSALLTLKNEGTYFITEVIELAH